MKTLAIFLFPVIFATACSSSPEQSPTPSVPTKSIIAAVSTVTSPPSTVTPTAVPTSTPTPTRTITQTPTRTLTPTVTPTIGPVILNFDVASGVSDEDVKIIQEGIGYVRTHIEKMLGGDISSATVVSLTVKIVASGKGNQEPGGGGACCTALDKNGARLFFDVKHPDWIANSRSLGQWSGTVNLQKIVAHEYVHAWQYSLGCLTFNKPYLADWMNEGIGEFLAYDSMIQRRYMTSDAVRAFQLNGATVTGELNYPLASLKGPGSLPVWPGHVGYLAVEWLVLKSKLGSLSLRRICEETKAGTSTEKAFENAFGITEDEFYRQFPAYINSLR